MRISNLEMLNFRNHEKTFMIFGESVNLVLGRNNAGKSTIKGGLQLALTGENEWCSSGENGELIRTGQKAAVVEAEVVGLGIVRRSIALKGNTVQLNGATVPDREVEKDFINEFGTSYNVMNCVLNSSQFLKMKANEQKDFLVKLSGITLDKQKVISFMKSPSQEAVDQVEKSLPDNVSIESLDATYKEFYSSRTAVKKVRDSLKAKLDAMGVIPESSDIDITSINAKLSELKGKRDETVSKLAVIEEREKLWDTLNTKLERLKNEIAAIEEKLDNSLDLSKSNDEIAELKDCETKLNSDIRSETTKKDTLAGQNESLSKIISRLSQEHCPLSDKLICTADKKSLENQLQKQIDDNNSLISESEEKIKQWTEELQGKKSKRDHIESQVKLNNECTAKKGEKDTLTKELAEIELTDSTTLQLDLHNVEAEEDSFNTQKAEYENWLKRKNEFDKLNEEYLQEVNKANMYEYLVKEFDSSGIKARILEKIIAPVENRCNTMLAKLTNNEYSLKFNFEDKEFNIMVTNLNGTVKVEKMSKSEIFRISIIIQEAISNLAGLKFLYIDDAEILIADDVNMGLLMDLLNEISNEYDQIFITATVADIKNIPINNIPANSTIFYVENGIVHPPMAA